MINAIAKSMAKMICPFENMLIKFLAKLRITSFKI